MQVLFVVPMIAPVDWSENTGRGRTPIGTTENGSITERLALNPRAYYLALRANRDAPI